jgi:capsular exopolysaccharide synthesis family protein
MENNTDLLITINPKSMFSESIKNIRTNLQFSAVDKELKVILNTSPEAGDGKSFITANLAAAYAQEGKKVLLIDADLRRGRQHEIFNVLNVTSGGYSNLILNYRDDTPLDKYICTTEEKNIHILPTGPTPPNPVELLGSENNRRLIKTLRKKYDIILLDCPPVLGLSDALILTQFSDANIMTFSIKKTKKENLERAIKAFDTANAKITGIVVNRATMSKNGYYGYYYNDYYASGEKI